MNLRPHKTKQMFLPFPGSPATNLNLFPTDSPEERGAVFTRHEVVNFILDLAGYTSDLPLHTFRLLEPSCGHGDFLLPIVSRLLQSYTAHTTDISCIREDLSDAIRAVEIHRESLEHVRSKLMEIILGYGVIAEEAKQLLNLWLMAGDFLLVDLPYTFTHVVGNPPYVRQEQIPDALMAEYRIRYDTIYDRADLYVPFIERCLTLLGKGGILGFICSDRWMKNRYGGPLRYMVSGQYHLAGYVDMVDTPAFHSEVSAYPAITIIRREKPGPTRIAHRPHIDREILGGLAHDMCADHIPEGSGVIEVTGVTAGSEPWILQSFDQLAVVRRLEAEFPALEDAGCRVGIGVATGADKVFIGPYEGLDVEPDRKLPLATTRDIESGTVQWHGLGVINPFKDNGTLVDLQDYPRLAKYIKKHEGILRKRNCAKRNHKGWYRTIDRIYPELIYQPKLLIPDIKEGAHIVYEKGELYPHHNLYFITSESWDLQALQAVLRSGIAKLFVSIYSTRMRGGYLRFQAQYLRRIRLPRWQEVPAAVRKALVHATGKGDINACNRAAFELYRLTADERRSICDDEI